MSQERIGRPIIPREHGAWAVLVGAFLAGVGVAGRATLPVALLLGGVILLALANGPLAILLRNADGGQTRNQQRQVFGWVLVYGAGAAACLTPLMVLYQMRFLLPFGMAAALFFILRAFLVREGKDRSLSAELVGTAGLTLAGPTAHAVAVGGAEPIGPVLWLLLLLFFVSGVLYVRMRIRVVLAQRRGTTAASNPARAWCIVYHLLLLFAVPALVAGQLIPWPVLLAFAPALWRTAAGLRRQEAPLNLKRLGWSEVSLTAAFVVLLVSTF
jgi:hypothetical protein